MLFKITNTKFANASLRMAECSCYGLSLFLIYCCDHHLSYVMLPLCSVCLALDQWGPVSDTVMETQLVFL